MTPSRPDRLHLTKHHGAGNDFLVFLDADDSSPLDPDLVAALCDRHRGLGADGVIRVTRRPAGGQGAEAGPTELGMQLRNADGSAAETSGNGLRCLAQAAVDAGWARPPSFVVRTDAGPRVVDYVPGAAGSASAWVDMGRPRLGSEEDLGPTSSLRVGDLKIARRVDVGNPHLVLVGANWDMADLAIEHGLAAAGSPANVEFVTVDADGQSLRLQVWERGVGLTLACGTGSVAAAAVTRAAGMNGDRVTVHNPGGPLEVAFDGDAARLGGPVHRVAGIEVDVAALLSAVA